MKEAMYYIKKDKKVQCFLCPRHCVIPENQIGFCGTRQNQNGKLISLVYGRASGLQIDPIEKKPLYHFLPGSAVLSFGTVGCNFVCSHCQNWTTSQAKPEKWHSYSITPEEIVEKSKEEGCESIAYTYNEPTMFYEYMLETAKIAKKNKIKNIMVSNGFIEQKPLIELCKYLDAVNIDLKSIDNNFYQKISGAWIEPVLETLKTINQKKPWLEVTNLLIPKLNDKPQQINKLIEWIKKNLGKEVPLHFSAFFPAYKLNDMPSTDAATLMTARKTAIKQGLKYVYLGNIATTNEENTHCPKCKKRIIQRVGYNIITNEIKKGKCLHCGYKIAGVW